MAFLRPGSRSAKAFGVAFDTDRDTREPASIALHGSGRFEHLEAQERRQKLPIFGVREHILKLIEEHATTIIVGETGCGKSTQVPQYLLESGWADDGYRVVCTQPRRVAAMMVAGQVAEEMGCAVGEEVGYAIRFEDVSSPGRTRLTYVTDGLLMREMMDDPLLSGYSVVMVDEAHERSCMTDLLLGLLKQIQRQRPQLRLVIASATLDAKGIASFFDTAGTAAARPGAPSRTPAVISVEGRNHPVTLHYLQQPAADYVRAAVDAVVAIHKQDLPGDVLIFLTGAEDCQDCVALMQEEARQLKKSRLALQLLPLPLYAGLEFSAQRRALSAAPRGFRKAIVATNVAETSLTIEGVTSVVDCGFAKQRCYNPLTGLDSLLIAPISQASADQRAGRSGRVRPGHCYRLYTQAEFQGRLRRAQVPEVQRSELSGVVLQLKALGVRNLLRFPFLDPPPAEAMVRALELLYALRAIDDLAELTPHPGAQMAELPVSPMLAAALLSSAELGCSEELLTIAACLGVTSVWAPQGRRAQDEAKERFAVAEGDLITYLNVFKAWSGVPQRQRGKWCSENGINAKAMLRASDIRLQLRHHLRALSVPLKSCDGDVAAVQKALVKGLFANAVRFDRTLVNPHAPDAPGTHLYQLVRLEGGASSGIQLRIHPSSVLWRCRPQWALFWSVQQTDRGWFDMQDLVAVQPEWIAEAAPEMFEFSRP